MRWVFGVLLLLGCTANTDELKAVQARLDARLARLTAAANTLNEERRQLEVLRQRLAGAMAPLAGDSAALAQIDVIRAGPTAPDTEALPAVPPVSSFEGVEQARRRAQIEDTRRRIVELEKLLGSVAGLDAEKDALRRKIELAERLAGAAPKPPP